MNVHVNHVPDIIHSVEILFMNLDFFILLYIPTLKLDVKVIGIVQG